LQYVNTFTAVLDNTKIVSGQPISCRTLAVRWGHGTTWSGDGRYSSEKMAQKKKHCSRSRMCMRYITTATKGQYRCLAGEVQYICRKCALPFNKSALRNMGLLRGLHEVGLMSRDPIFVMLFFFLWLCNILGRLLSGFGYKIYCVVLKRHCSELLQCSRYIIMYFSVPCTFAFFYLLVLRWILKLFDSEF
jgi:hypothetical protein